MCGLVVLEIAPKHVVQSYWKLHRNTLHSGTENCNETSGVVVLEIAPKHAAQWHWKLHRNTWLSHPGIKDHYPHEWKCLSMSVKVAYHFSPGEQLTPALSLAHKQHDAAVAEQEICNYIIQNFLLLNMQRCTPQHLIF